MFTSSTWIIGAAIGGGIGLLEAGFLAWLGLRRKPGAAAGPDMQSQWASLPWALIIGSPVVAALAGAFIADRLAGVVS